MKRKIALQNKCGMIEVYYAFKKIKKSRDIQIVTTHARLL